MKNQTDYRKLKIQVENVLEIRLSIKTWNQIRYASMMKRRTYSWVVRYAVFRMIKRGNLEDYIKGSTSQRTNNSMKYKFERISQILLHESKTNSNKHRHKLCLYGDDELLIRLSAARMKCTMTHLVRLSLMYYLDELLLQIGFLGRSKLTGRYFARIAWYWLGIKICKGVEFPNRGTCNHYFKFRRFEKGDYW